MKISETQVNANADIVGNIKAIEDLKQVTTKFGTQVSLTVAILEDDSGTIKLNLWGSQSEGIEEGKTVEIKNGFVKEFKGEKQISVGKMGSVKVVE
ncbi:MAG: DNA-binding protein [Nanoarchaeota archaeon]|nr:DNA-binding protein [Nanoarchaeota archaeon]